MEMKKSLKKMEKMTLMMMWTTMKRRKMKMARKKIRGVMTFGSARLLFAIRHH